MTSIPGSYSCPHCAIRARRPLSHYSYSPSTPNSSFSNSNMAPRTRVVSSSSTGSASSPSRPPSESPIEVAYNTAVQSFVRRDHIRTQAAISTLLKLVETIGDGDNSKSSGSRWYEIKEDGETEGYEWKIKVLKLVISAYASLYSDPSNSVNNNTNTNSHTDELPSEIKDILPPASPDRALDHVLNICQKTLNTTNLLPPQLVSTLILASLKLKPSTPALGFAHRLTETWLADIPDDFIRLISTPGNGNNKTAQSSSSAGTAAIRKRIESTREAYLKVVELFVGEVLAREGEYEMARAFLDGEDVLGSNRKENLYRHLRSIETRSTNSNSKSGSSPSNSGILPAQSPSASLVLPTPSTSRPNSRNGNQSQDTNRSRSSSTSSSSSERTARPRSAITGNGKGKSIGLAPVPTPASRRTAAGLAKGKEREKQVEVDTGSVDTNSTLPVPKRIYVNASPPSGQGSSRRNNTNKKTPSMVQRNITSILDLIPLSIKKRIISPSFLVSTVLPIPLVIILLAIWIRRRARRSIVGVGTALASQATAAAGAGSGVEAGSGDGVGAGLVTGLAGSVITADTVRQRLERVRQRGGFKAWVVYWIRWWISKFIGVIKMGLTITYL